jgi:hypothetical protein
MPDTDHTPLNHKLESALASYLVSVRSAAGLGSVQIVASFEDVTLQTPRIVVSCDAMSPRTLDLPGVMDCAVEIVYHSQRDTTIAAHKTAAAKLTSWLHDLAAVQTALSAGDAMHCYFIQFTGLRFEAAAEEGTHQTLHLLQITAQGASV